MNMQTDLKVRQLNKGQLWRLKKRFILIVALENLCVRYKLMDQPNQTEEKTLTGDVDALWRYLMARRAELLPNQQAV
jgi:hypothetical protein